MYNRVNNCLRIYAFIIFLYVLGWGTAEAKRTMPLVWNMTELEQMKADIYSIQVQSIINEADKCCKTQPVVITEKPYSYAPDEHYYCSLSIYWWPNSDDPNGKYIRKDGMVNPESYQYDYSRLLNLSSRCKSLSKAFYLTNNEKYYLAFAEQIRVWFVEKDTYMYPNFEYSQVVPGYYNNKGKSSGMIDAYIFNGIIESVRLVESVKKLDRETMRGLKTWFLNFVEWSELVYGDTMRKGTQNISLAYDIIILNIYLFVGERRKARQIIDGFAEKRLNIQISKDGSQPEELVRTRAIYYSLYNLAHIMDFCFLARELYGDYYNKHRERIDKAVEFIKYYVDNPEACPYQQITGWDECRSMLNIIIKRQSVLGLQ